MAFERFPYSNFHDLNLDWIIKQVKEWAEEWAVVKKAYEDLSVDLTEIYQRLDAIDNIDTQLSADVTELYNKVAAINNNISRIDDTINIMSVLVEDQYTDLNARVTAIETEATFYMFSPFTGLYVPITQVITELAQFHLEDALTAGEYDALDMTAGAYDNKQLTAIQYDASGKTLLP